MAVALETIYHQSLDEMPKVKRARTERVEWFQTTQNNFENVKLALQSVGQGVYYDFKKLGNALPSQLVGKGVKLSGGQVLETTTHAFRKSPRLMEMAEQGQGVFRPQRFFQTMNTRLLFQWLNTIDITRLTRQQLHTHCSYQLTEHIKKPLESCR